MRRTKPSAMANAIARLRQRADGVWMFFPVEPYAREGVAVAVLGRDEATARRRFEERCAEIARSVTPTPIIRFEQPSRAVHPLDANPDALIALPGRDGWSIVKGPNVIASGLPPFRALDMVREAGGVVERSLDDA